MSLTTRERNVDNLRTPACIRATLSARHFIEHLEHGASGTEELAYFAVRNLHGASPPAAYDKDLIGKGVALRRQAIAGAKERATRAAGMLLDLEPVAWEATAEFTCEL